MYEDSVLPVLLPKQIGDKGLQNPVQRNQVTYPIRQEVVVLQRNWEKIKVETIILIVVMVTFAVVICSSLVAFHILNLILNVNLQDCEERVFTNVLS